MEVFRVESYDIAYDEDVSMIIIAKTESRALEIAKKNWKFRSSRTHEYLQVIKVDINKEQIVDISHYGE